MHQNQVLAVEKGVKARAEKALTEAHHKVMKTELVTGMVRVYSPKDNEGEQLPPEKKVLQVKVDDELEKLIEPLGELIDIRLTKDKGNQSATGYVLDEYLPVETLLFLEKQLVNLHTFIAKLPVLDPAEEWTYDTGRGCYVTDALPSVRTKKVLRNHVKAEATDKHPAQVEVYGEDVQVGTYQLTKFSGAMRADDKKAMLDRVEQLQADVKKARETANETEVERVKGIGERMLRYLFGA